MLPDCWQVSVLIGEVEEGCEIFNAQWSQMLELVDCESICTGGSGVFAEADSGVNLSGSEGGVRVVQRKSFMD